MENDISEIKEKMVMMVVRIPLILRCKLKMISASENLTMNKKVRNYIERGIKQDQDVTKEQ